MDALCSLQSVRASRKLCPPVFNSQGLLIEVFVCLCAFSLYVLSVFANLCVQYPTEEDMMEWAKRESEREEKERLARLTQQEQEDLELAIALSKSELS